MNQRFAVGDVVLITSTKPTDYDDGCNDSPGFVEEMERELGKMGVVTCISEQGCSVQTDRFDEDWTWRPRDLSIVEDADTIAKVLADVRGIRR